MTKPLSIAPATIYVTDEAAAYLTPIVRNLNMTQLQIQSLAPITIYTRTHPMTLTEAEKAIQDYNDALTVALDWHRQNPVGTKKPPHIQLSLDTHDHEQARAAAAKDAAT